MSSRQTLMNLVHTVTAAQSCGSSVSAPVVELESYLKDPGERLDTSFLSFPLDLSSSALVTRKHSRAALKNCKRLGSMSPKLAKLATLQGGYAGMDAYASAGNSLVPDGCCRRRFPGYGTASTNESRPTAAAKKQ
ncbi:hypothetical protein TKK_0006086 [Trichogramma kaykai]